MGEGVPVREVVLAVVGGAGRREVVAVEVPEEGPVLLREGRHLVDEDGFEGRVVGEVLGPRAAPVSAVDGRPRAVEGLMTRVCTVRLAP